MFFSPIFRHVLVCFLRMKSLVKFYHVCSQNNKRKKREKKQRTRRTGEGGGARGEKKGRCSFLLQRTKKKKNGRKINNHAEDQLVWKGLMDYPTSTRSNPEIINNYESLDQSYFFFDINSNLRILLVLKWYKYLKRTSMINETWIWTHRNVFIMMDPFIQKSLSEIIFIRPLSRNYYYRSLPCIEYNIELDDPLSYY